MGMVGERLRAFSTNRWLVFVAAMWLQSMAGIGYLFGAISPVVKDALGYNQRQVATLGIAKDLGDCVGFLAGSLSAMLPPWAMLLIGAVQNFIGYGWLWLIVTKQAPALPLSMVSFTHLLILPFIHWFSSLIRFFIGSLDLVQVNVSALLFLVFSYRISHSVQAVNLFNNKLSQIIIIHFSY